MADPTKTILLVEDDDDVRALFRTILAKKGYEVLEARDGASAVELAARHEGPIDLLLANVALPRLSGYDVRQQLRASRPEMSVLYVSGYLDGEKVERARNEAGSHFVQKPLSMARLVELVADILGQRVRSSGQG